MSLGIASDNVRIWLESKLEKPWGGPNVAYLLTKDVLALIVDQWGTLDTTLKLRLLCALMSVKPIQLRNMQDEIQKMIALTCEDGDGWVQILGNLISTVLRPDSPEFNFGPLKTHTLTAPLIQKLQEQLNSIEVSDYGPAEEAYLQKSNYSKAPNTHFTVAKPAARKTVSRDLLTSSLNTRAGLVSSKPGITGGPNRQPGSILSSSGNVGSRPLGSSSSGIGSPSRPSSSVLGGGASRPEGHRRFIPAAAPVQDDIIMMVDPIAMAIQEQQKKEEEKRKKDDVKAARVAKKAAAEARKEGKEEDAGVLQLGKLSQSFETAKPPKKKAKLKEGEVPSGTAPAATAATPKAPPSLTTNTPTPAATTAATPTAAGGSGNSNDFADAFLLAAEVTVPGAAPSDNKPKMAVQPPSLVSHQAAVPQQLVTSASLLPMYGKVASTPSSSINQVSVPPNLMNPLSARPPVLVSGGAPPPLKSFNAGGAVPPMPLSSMAPTGGLASMASLQSSSSGIALPSNLNALSTRPLSGPSIAPGVVSNVSYTPTQHVFQPMSAYNPSSQGAGGLSSISSSGMPSSAPISLPPMPLSLAGSRPMGMPTSMASMPGVGGGGLASFPKQPLPSGQPMPSGQPLPYGAFPTQAPMPMSSMPSMAPNFGAKPAALTSTPLNKPSLAQPPRKD